jgi:hypothetical protein
MPYLKPVCRLGPVTSPDGHEAGSQPGGRPAGQGQERKGRGGRSPGKCGLYGACTICTSSQIISSQILDCDRLLAYTYD